MKNHDEMYKSLLSRYDDYQEKKKRKIIIAKRTLSLAACFAVIFSGYQIWQNVPKTPQNPPVTEESSPDSTDGESEDNIPDTESTEPYQEQPQTTTSAQDSEEIHTTQTTHSAITQIVTETQAIGTGAVHSESQAVVQQQTQSQPLTTQIRTEQTKPLQTTVHTTVKPQVTHTVTQTKPVKTTTHTTTQPQTTYTSMQTKPAKTTTQATQTDTYPIITKPAETDDRIPMASGIVQTTTTEDQPTGGMPATTTTTSVPMPGGSYEKQFKIIENVSYNGKIWNKLIFTGSDTSSSQHEHLFDVAGFTVTSDDKDRQQISLKHETGLTLSINYRDYDDFFIYCNPNMNNYYSFYEINGKKVVREKCDSESDKNILHPEYTPCLIAWEDGSHVFWTMISDDDYPLLENLIANQTTY